jgi:TolB-like protein/class 3 adenylate cyclase/Flp pilus assembly protein TadD
MTATRRLAAILAADVVGYSRLMGEDEVGTARAVREHREASRPIVAGLGGRIVKTTGDGLLLEFSSVVAAVECAIAIQKLMAERNAGTPEAKRVVYRIGVNLGDVLIEGDDILGDGVNIAARLEGICEPGGVLISGAAYDHVRGRIDAAFGDLGEKTLKNIAQPVRVYAVRGGGAPRPTMLARPKRRAALLGIVGLILVCAAGGWLLVANRPAAVTTSPSTSAAALAEAKHFSIVVLPFKNLSGDPSQDYFADGVTDNLTTDLSRIPNSFVIASTTAFTYKGKTVDAKEIGKELGVRYVLEGAVQREGTRVRVNAQLIDAETGAHLWAERFEEDIADLFKLQDQAVARLANTLGYQLVKAEAEKGARSKNPDAVDLTMRGMALFERLPLTKDQNDAARTLFEQALKIDPNDADALAGAAAAHLHEKQYGWTSPGIDERAKAKILDPAERAIALAPNNEKPYYTKSFYLFLARRENEALGAAEAGLAINPNSPLLYGQRALIEIALGRFEQAKADVTKAMRLSPHDPFMYFWPLILGDSELGLGHLDAAAEAYQKAIDLGLRNFPPYVDLAAVYALQGKTEEAKVALVEARRLEPKLTVKWLQTVAPNIPSLFEGVRKAGLPEDEAVEPPHLSIVVLPFANLSGDSSQDYFADGITENLTTDLSRIPNSFVIARNTAFTYKGKNVDAKTIGKDLGVRYVLEGSVQRDGSRVRVGAQLIDAETGAHLWADRFEEDMSDLFKMQDQVVARLGNVLGFELFKAEAKKGVRSNNPDAIDLAMRGWATMWQSYPMPPKEKRDSHYAALDLFNEALKADPNDADALAGEAFTHMSLFMFGESDAEANSDARIVDPADRAIALTPDDMRAYVAKSFYLAVTGRPAEALRTADSGLAVNPNSAPLLDARALARIVLGDFERAKSDAQQAMRLSPRDPEIPNRLVNMGMAELGLGNFSAAVVEFQKAIDAGDHSFIPYVNLAAAYALDGKTEQARSALAQAQRLNANLTVKWLTDHAPHLPPLFDGLRRAGLAEDGSRNSTQSSQPTVEQAPPKP